MRMYRVRKRGVVRMCWMPSRSLLVDKLTRRLLLALCFFLALGGAIRKVGNFIFGKVIFGSLISSSFWTSFVHSSTIATVVMTINVNNMKVGLPRSSNVSTTRFLDFFALPIAFIIRLSWDPV